MAENDFIAFAVGSGANVETQSAYLSDSVVGGGFQSGIAASIKANKVLRQGTSMAAAIGNFIAAYGYNALDNANIPALATAFENALAAFIEAEFPATAGNFLSLEGGTVTGTTDFAAALYGPGINGSTNQYAVPALRDFTIIQNSTSGYAKGPGGFVLQWQNSSVNGNPSGTNTVDVTLDYTYSTIHLSSMVQFTGSGPPPGASLGSSPASLSTVAVTISAGAATPYGIVVWSLGI